MTINEYLIGNVINLTGSFYDANNNLADPTEVSIKIKTPLNEIEEPALVRESIGVYSCEYTPQHSGMYYYIFTGSGVLVSASQDQFNIIETSF